VWPSEPGGSVIAMTEDPKGLRERLSTQGEQALGKLAQDLLDNPLVSNALTRAFDARERAVQAQEVAMGALNIPSAADIERLTRRLRSVAQRLEGIEDALDRLDRRLESSAGQGGSDIAAKLDELAAEVRKLADRPEPKPKPEPKGKPKPKPKAKPAA
jgi:outer membrane biosynthesis protein TonB